MFIIPKRLSKRTEIIDGIGLKEIAIFFIFFMIGLVVFMVAGLFNAGIIFRAVLLGVISLFGFGIVYPIQYGENVIVLFRRFLKFKNQQNKYFYVRGTGGFNGNDKR